MIKTSAHEIEQAMFEALSGASNRSALLKSGMAKLNKAAELLENYGDEKGAEIITKLMEE